jgi:hypothetical protein
MDLMLEKTTITKRLTSMPCGNSKHFSEKKINSKSWIMVEKA